MTAEEYNMPFAKWVTDVKNEQVSTNRYGSVDWTESRNNEVKTKWHDVWEEERRHFVSRTKAEKISHALEALRASGHPGILHSQANGHITANSKHGVVLSYYATTETIVGYKDTEIFGISEFIRLLEEI